jgi:hypothetical protein
MCTVTVVPQAQGARLLCNRDERRSRPAALPPEIHDLRGRLAAFPVDPQGGGTWIGVNDAGLIVTLLNVQRTSDGRRDDASRKRRSRGLVVRELLRWTSLPHATAAVESLEPYAFEPFQVVIVYEGRVAVATSDAAGPIRCTQQTLDEPVLFTSSSLGDALVGLPRRRLFERMVVRSRTGWLDGQARFHDHQWSQRPEISIRMERRDALTVSRTSVDVRTDRRQLLYEAPLEAATPDRVRKWCSLH